MIRTRLMILVPSKSGSLFLVGSVAVRHKVLAIGGPITAERCTGTRTLSAETALFVSLSASVNTQVRIK